MKNVLYEKKGSVALITFNRPDSLNAFCYSMFQELIDFLEEAQNDPEVRVLVLTGAGKSFSAGVDLREVDQFLATDISLLNSRQMLKRYSELTRCMVKLSKPIIAAINGVAVGVGAEISIASDIRIASDQASFAFAEVRRGLFETNGVMHFLPRLVGRGRAAHWLYTGEKITADAALGAGLVTRVVPGESLLETTLSLARQIAANAPISVRLVKKVLQRTDDLDLEAIMLLEEDGMFECLTSEDLQEGVHAFLEKRTPLYQGR
ncbi:MAG: enoyl-CoA hydratase/isomerase family protein [Chloroflexi bacterium]|nr:enoyl-CoA hydratase/isomerase family protein [Chloroflexota bacterium]